MSESDRETLDYWIRVFIAAAETNIHGVKMGEEKKEFVLNQLEAMGLVFDKATVSLAIDGLCRELTSEFVINS